MTKREQREVEIQRKKAMTKKQLKELHKAERTRALFNTGTRTMKSAKDYDRAKSKRETRKALEEQGQREASSRKATGLDASPR